MCDTFLIIENLSCAMSLYYFHVLLLAVTKQTSIELIFSFWDLSFLYSLLYFNQLLLFSHFHLFLLLLICVYDLMFYNNQYIKENLQTRENRQKELKL